MNYLALAGFILAALMALYCLLRLIAAASGRRRFPDSGGLPGNAAAVAIFATFAAWLFGMVAA